MSGLIVGGVAIPISFSASRPRLDLVQRSRALDGTYRAASIGTAKREWMFQTPPISRANAEIYEAILSNVGSQNCSGDIIGGSSNLLLYSEQIDNAAWTKGATTVSADISTAPNNTVTGDKILEAASTAQHYVRQSVTCAVTKYTFSVWLSQSVRTTAVVTMSDASGDASTAVDLSTGVLSASGLSVGNWGGITSSITSVFDVWYRVSVTATRGGDTVTIPGVFLKDASSYLGVVTTGLYMWGAQLEAAAVASPYLATTTVARSTLTTSCFAEITGWAPVGTPGSHYVQLSFTLHEA